MLPPAGVCAQRSEFLQQLPPSVRHEGRGRWIIPADTPVRNSLHGACIRRRQIQLPEQVVDVTSRGGVFETGRPLEVSISGGGQLVQTYECDDASGTVGIRYETLENAGDLRQFDPQHPPKATPGSIAGNPEPNVLRDEPCDDRKYGAENDGPCLAHADVPPKDADEFRPA